MFEKGSPMLGRVLAIAISSLLATAAWGQEAKKKEWKDRAEYDLFEGAQKEQTPAKRLEILNTWKQKYPTTDFAVERLQLFIVAHQQLGQVPKIVESAEELVKLDGSNLMGLYWLTILTPNLGSTDAAVLDRGQKAGNGLIASLDSNFAASKKPATTSEADWKRARDDMEAAAHKTLGWVATQRKDAKAAEESYRKSLEFQPRSGEVSYWYYQILRTNPDRQSDALFHLARAATLTGAGALPEPSRKQIEDFFTKAYTKFRGSNEGLAELKEMAGKSALPPEGYKIKSGVELAIEKEEELKKTNPQLALWMSLKKELLGENGEQYFNEHMKDAAVPKLKGKLISFSPARGVKELVLGLEQGDRPEVTLKLDAALAGTADPGVEIEFEGIPKAFSKDPFMVTFEVEKASVSGWPAKPLPPPAKKAPPAKKRKK